MSELGEYEDLYYLESQTDNFLPDNVAKIAAVQLIDNTPTAEAAGAYRRKAVTIVSDDRIAPRDEINHQHRSNSSMV